MKIDATTIALAKISNEQDEVIFALNKEIARLKGELEKAKQAGADEFTRYHHNPIVAQKNAELELKDAQGAEMLTAMQQFKEKVVIAFIARMRQGSQRELDEALQQYKTIITSTDLGNATLERMNSLEKMCNERFDILATANASNAMMREVLENLFGNQITELAFHEEGGKVAGEYSWKDVKQASLALSGASAGWVSVDGELVKELERCLRFHLHNAAQYSSMVGGPQTIGLAVIDTLAAARHFTHPEGGK